MKNYAVGALAFNEFDLRIELCAVDLKANSVDEARAEGIVLMKQAYPGYGLYEAAACHIPDMGHEAKLEAAKNKYAALKLTASNQEAELEEQWDAVDKMTFLREIFGEEFFEE
jgi:hypothetical protein